MTWRVFPLATRTGRVGSELPSARVGAWRILLSATEEVTVTASWDTLGDGTPGFGARDPMWRHALTGGLVLAHECDHFPLVPIVAGPLTYTPQRRRGGLVELSAAGLRHCFKGRLVMDRDYAPGEEMVNAGVHAFGVSLGSIAWHLASLAMLRKAGDLPLIRGSVLEYAAHERQYPNWDTANNTVDKRWTELSEVIGGPDIMIRPEWGGDDHNTVVWRFLHGSDKSPQIPQDHTPVFDCTATGGPVSDWEVSVDSSLHATRVWGTGSGQGAGTIHAMHENDRLQGPTGMLWEVVNSVSGEDNPDVVSAHARRRLEDGARPLAQVTLSVSADHQINPLGSFFVGDTCRVVLPRGQGSVLEGEHDLLLIGMKGSDSERVDLEFQEVSA